MRVRLKFTIKTFTIQTITTIITMVKLLATGQMLTHHLQHKLTTCIMMTIKSEVKYHVCIVINDYSFKKKRLNFYLDWSLNINSYQYSASTSSLSSNSFPLGETINNNSYMANSDPSEPIRPQVSSINSCQATITPRLAKKRKLIQNGKKTLI